MQINGRSSICGLIGNPVEHTLSPMIHNTLAEKLGHNLVYVPFLVEKESLKEAVTGAYALHIQGMNITVPYKSTVIEMLSEIDALAGKIGAVNTLVRTQNGYKGYNTDMTGLYRAMGAENIRLAGERVILLGAGGAARAVAFMCVHYGAEKVYLLNRTLEKAKTVAAEVNVALQTDAVTALRTEDYWTLQGNSYLAIQGTNVGLYPNTEETVITEEDFYRKIDTGYDLIYRPEKTMFMRLVEKAGGKAYNGLRMLLYQALEAYELWNRAEISEELAAEIYELLKKEMNTDE